MKVAIISSRNLKIENIKKYLPPETTEIVSGGAKGADACAKAYAIKNNIRLTEFLPDYKKFGKSAPLIRNREIIYYCDFVLAFWDCKSRGTKFTVDFAEKQANR